MGATSFYAYPYPDATSTVDVPRDIKALADKLELMKNGLTVPDGDVYAGGGGGGARYLTSCRNGRGRRDLGADHSDHGRRVHRDSQENAIPLQTLQLNNDGSMNRYFGGRHSTAPVRDVGGARKHNHDRRHWLHGCVEYGGRPIYAAAGGNGGGDACVQCLHRTPVGDQRNERHCWGQAYR